MTIQHRIKPGTKHSVIVHYIDGNHIDDANINCYYGKYILKNIHPFEFTHHNQQVEILCRALYVRTGRYSIIGDENVYTVSSVGYIHARPHLGNIYRAIEEINWHLS